MESLVRARIARLAAALRRFGIVDRFGLGRLLDDPDPPSVEAIRARLRSEPDELPPGVSAKYLAEAIHREVVGDEVDVERGAEVAMVLESLAAIPPGREDAGRYQDQVIQIVNLLFRGELVFGKKESDQHSGRKRIDIVYKNVASSGVFFDLRTVHRFHAPYIPVECKNYSDDPANNEFDQLLGRLNDTVGHVGILTVRTVEDVKAVQLRRIDAHRQKKFVFVLCDSDFRSIAADRVAGRPATVLEEQVRSYMLG